MTQLLPCVEIEPTHKARAAIIWLHGLGANGHDFEPIVPQLGLTDDAAVRFVFPHAPALPVTINNGYVMPAWFDITSLDSMDGVSESDIAESITLINALIEREHERGIEYENIVMAGFSQGGVIALHTAALFPHKLGGVLALSTYLPLYETLKNTASGKNANTPLFAAHGAHDPVIPFRLAKQSQQLLATLFNNIEWHEYAMEHSVCFEEIQAIGEWLKTLPTINNN